MRGHVVSWMRVEIEERLEAWLSVKLSGFQPAAALAVASLLFVTFAGILGPGSEMAWAEAKSCTTSQCHSKVGRGANVHPALAMECTFCHQPVDEKTMYDGARHSFKMAADGAELCYQCHEAKNTQAVVHVPVAGGLCTFCHDPHQSENARLLKADPLPELCFQCHARDKDTEAYVHGPVALGLCTACHDPHQSAQARLLRREGPDLCFQCHGEKQEAISTGESVHPPAMLDCTMCHDPHTSPNKYQLKNLPPELCFTCHGDIQERVEQSRVVHGALQIEGKCLNCHDPHATGHQKLTKRAGMSLCLGCHDKPQKDTEGKELANIKDILDENPDHHGPILAGDCVLCHNPHGSPNFRLLQRAFPATYYAPFREESYALCFGCHESSLALEAQTSTATDFRNAEKNLHFVHVNKEPKGRTCRFCHRFHASTKPRHIRESITFGQWELPLKYQALPNGGKCMPGCHAPKGYDRKEAVQNPIDYETFTGASAQSAAPIQ